MGTEDVFMTTTSLPDTTPWFVLAAISMADNKIIPDNPIKVSAVSSDNAGLTDEEEIHLLSGGTLVQY